MRKLPYKLPGLEVGADRYGNSAAMKPTTRNGQQRDPCGQGPTHLEPSSILTPIHCIVAVPRKCKLKSPNHPNPNPNCNRITFTVSAGPRAETRAEARIRSLQAPIRNLLESCAAFSRARIKTCPPSCKSWIAAAAGAEEGEVLDGGVEGAVAVAAGEEEDAEGADAGAAGNGDFAEVVV